MSSKEFEQLKEKLGSFEFVSLKEINHKDLVPPLRAMTRKLLLHAEGILSCWCEDEIFIKENDQRNIAVLARFMNKDNGEFFLIQGNSVVAAMAPGQGALLHIRIGHFSQLKR